MVLGYGGIGERISLSMVRQYESKSSHEDASRLVLDGLPTHFTLSPRSNHITCMITNCSLFPFYP